MTLSLEQGDDLRQHFLQLICRESLYPAPVPSRDIKDARLIAAYNAGRLDAGNLDGEANPAREFAATCDR